MSGGVIRSIISPRKFQQYSALPAFWTCSFGCQKLPRTQILPCSANRNRAVPLMQNVFSSVTQVFCNADAVIKAQIATFFSAAQCDLYVIQRSPTARSKLRYPCRALSSFISAARFRRCHDANKKGTYALACVPFFPLFFNGSDPVLRPGQAAAHGHAEGIRPHMAADAEGQRIGKDAISRQSSSAASS